MRRTASAVLSYVLLSCRNEPPAEPDAEQLVEPESHLWLGAGPHPCSPRTPAVLLSPTNVAGTPASTRGHVYDQRTIEMPIAAQVCISVTSALADLRPEDVQSVRVDGKTLWSYEACHPSSSGVTPPPGCEGVRSSLSRFDVAMHLPAGTRTIEVALREQAAPQKRVGIVAQGPAATTSSPASARAGELVTIQGEGFTQTPDAMQVAIGSTEFPIVSIGEAGDTMQVRVPARSVVGSFAVSNALGGALAPEPFDGGNWACKPPFEIGTYSKPASDAIAFDSVIEAAGYSPSDKSDWLDTAAGNLCGRGDKELLLLRKHAPFFSVLDGPTPHLLSANDFGLGPSTTHPWKTIAVGNLVVSPPGEADYDEFVALRRTTSAGVADLFVGAAHPTTCEVHEIASVVLGSQGNSEWVDAAIGDFDADGNHEIALVKNEHSNVLIVELEQGTLVPVLATDLDSSSSAPWKAIAAGNVDGVEGDEIVLARHVSDRRRATVIAFGLVGNELVTRAETTFGNNGNSRWTSAAVGDFNGDGRDSIVLVKNEHSNFAMLSLLPQQSGLQVVATDDLDSAKGQDWRGLTAVDWSPRGDQGAHELVAVRSARAPYHVDVFVYGNAFHRRPRDSALANLEGQEFGDNKKREQFRQRLIDTGTTTYQWFVTQRGDYKRLVNFLEDYARNPARYCIDGQQLRVWVGLSLYSNFCSPPEDDRRTTPKWKEHDFFEESDEVSKCMDFRGWSKVVNRLAQDYPQVVALGIDDMTHKLYSPSKQPCPATQDPALPSCHARMIEDDIAELSANLRRDSFWVSFAPTFYSRINADELTFQKYADLGKGIDSLLFFFRNSEAGMTACDASCPEDDPDACKFQCLAGACAERTIERAPVEMCHLQSTVPRGRPILLGVYASTHSCEDRSTLPVAATPSNKYTYELASLGLANPAFGFGGSMIYTMEAPTGVCPDGTCTYCNQSTPIPDKYCAVRQAFRAAPPSSPIDLSNRSCLDE